MMRSVIFVQIKLRFEAERTGYDANLKGVNGGRIRKESVNYSPLDEVNGIGYIDLGSSGINSKSIIPSWRGSCIWTFDKKLWF